MLTNKHLCCISRHINSLEFSGTTSPEHRETRLAAGKAVEFEVGLDSGGQIGGSETGGQINLVGGDHDQVELWQKNEGQVDGGFSRGGQQGAGLIDEGQPHQGRSEFENYLAWASPTWQTAQPG